MPAEDGLFSNLLASGWLPIATVDYHCVRDRTNAEEHFAHFALS